MRALAITVFALSGCIEPALQQCGDLVCAADALCRDELCISREALEACTGADDGAPCSTPQFSEGRCSVGACLEIACGNDVVDPGEVCDDGNHSSGDGCADDCQGLDVCPALGVTPSFSSSLQSMVDTNCWSYSTSLTRDIAVAQCDWGDTAGIGWGRIDEPLAAFPNLVVGTSATYSQPRLVPEGTELFLKRNSAGTIELLRYTINENNTATLAHVLGLTFSSSLRMGMPSQGPVRRAMIDSNGISAAEYEIAVDGSVRKLGSYTPAELGVEGFNSSLNLSPDGLRLLVAAYVAGDQVWMYSDRANLETDFLDLRPIGVTFSGTADLSMAPDCSRIYFTALNRVFFVRQR